MQNNDKGGIFEAVSVTSLGEEVYRRLRQAIVDGDLAPGEHLVETALARHMHVSRTPVRDALHQLVAEGLVVSDGVRGLVVARISLENIEHAYVLRESLEGLAARLAAQHQRPDLLRRLQDALRVMEHGRCTAQEFDEAHSCFHDTIAEMSDNPYLIKALADLQGFRTRMVSLDWVAKSRVHVSVPEHRRIFEAIEMRNPTIAEEEAQRHVRTTREGLLNRLQGHAGTHSRAENGL
ncbi:MAG: GntR family transcriptional regulator [Sulfobacillus acidophilus]|uniref:GntR family transcriptional regulator n=1 Tax=Sulfobacillus acidophilus TaxID=53633 RepID=A0A2T2WF13_9FIRM|nr:MAG: GntR family transcriptional regulator [Sulfobacillus acidophilus]